MAIVTSLEQTALLEENRMNDFSKKTLKALAKNGITIIGLTVIPDNTSSMPFANGDRGYTVNDNGTCRILTFKQVLNAAA